LRFNKKLLIKNVSQKKRTFYKKNFNLFLTHGSAGFFFFHTIKFECVYLKFLRRRLKLLLKRRKKNFLSRKIWINLKSNYPLSKKSKNSRMGKGKGSFLRWVIIIYSMNFFLEFIGFNNIFLIRLKEKLKFLYHTRINLIFEKKKISLWTRPDISKSLNYSRKKPIF